MHREVGLLLVCGQDHSGTQAYLLKVAFFGLGLHRGFATSYLETKAHTKALLFMHGCQILDSVQAVVLLICHLAPTRQFNRIDYCGD